MAAYSPVALFVYNRPAHTMLTVEALLLNDGIAETDLYVFSDGPRNQAVLETVEKVRAYVHRIKGVKSLHIIESETNKGLAQSITDGVTKLLDMYGRVIVLEDDLKTSPFFLTYMNKALDIYEDEAHVMHIAAHVPPLKEKLPPTFFYNQASCWGWATWKRAWDKFDSNAEALISKVNATNRLGEFNMDGSCDFMSQLEQNASGFIKTWAVKWQAVVFLNDGLCLHPGKSLVQNIGLDWTGEHTGPMPQYHHKKLASHISVDKIELKEDAAARKAIVGFYNKHKNVSQKESILIPFLKKVKRKLKSLFFAL